MDTSSIIFFTLIFVYFSLLRNAVTVVTTSLKGLKMVNFVSAFSYFISALC